MLAPPRSFSQLATTFIASQCQGIHRMHLVLDGNKVICEKNLNTFIGKTTFIASGMKVAHKLTDADNRLYVLSMKRLNLFNLVPALYAIYSGKPIENNDYISFTYAAIIEATRCETNNEVEFDGDPQGYLPCRISIAHAKLEIIADE